MLRVIDLDGQSKDADGLIFTLTIAGEKFGLTEQELVEIVRTKHGSGKGAGKRMPQRSKAPPQHDLGGSEEGSETNGGESDAEAGLAM